MRNGREPGEGVSLGRATNLWGKTAMNTTDPKHSTTTLPRAEETSGITAHDLQNAACRRCYIGAWAFKAIGSNPVDHAFMFFSGLELCDPVKVLQGILRPVSAGTWADCEARARKPSSVGRLSVRPPATVRSPSFVECPVTSEPSLLLNP